MTKIAVIWAYSWFLPHERKRISLHIMCSHGDVVLCAFLITPLVVALHKCEL